MAARVEGSPPPPDLRPNADGGRRDPRLEAGVAVQETQQSPTSGAQIDLDTTSFMISFVPPKIRVTRASRHSLAMRYSFI